MGPRSLSQDLQIVGLNVKTSCKNQVGGSLGTQRTVRVALPCYLLGRDRSPSGPVLWRACSTVFHACGPGAFREITQLEGSWVRWVFRPPRCCPRTSEVGTDLRAVRCCGGPALRCSMPADLALSEKSPHLEGSWVRWVFRPPRGCPRTSEVGTDLRAVRCCRQWHYKRTCRILRSSQNMPSPREDPNSLPDVLAARSTYRSTQLFP